MSFRGLIPPHLPNPYRKAIYKVAKCWEMTELAEVQVDPSIMYRSSVLRRYRLLGPVLAMRLYSEDYMITIHDKGALW